MTFRTAKPNEFTFKRNCEDVETAEHQGVIFATTGGPFAFTNRGLSDVTDECLMRAMYLAEEAGFWDRPAPKCGQSPTSVTVEVSP